MMDPNSLNGVETPRKAARSPSERISWMNNILLALNLSKETINPDWVLYEHSATELLTLKASKSVGII